MGDPSDTTGGDFTGGDDEEIILTAPSITSAAQTINGNTYAGAFNYTFQLNANPGSPATNIVWSLNGIGSLTQSGFYTFPSLAQGQTSSGQLVFTVSNNNGSSSQTWSYNIVNTQQPFFTSTVPANLNGNSSTAFVSISYQFSANRGAPNTSSPLTWNVSPQDYVAEFQGASDTVRTLSLSFPQGTITNGTYTVSISNANGSASQTWNYDINIGTTSGGGGGDSGLWELQGNNSIFNTNANGVNIKGALTIGDKYIFNGSELGWISRISNTVDASPAVRPEGYYMINNVFYYYYRLVNASGYISWKNLTDIPPLPTVADNKAALALGAIGAALGFMVAGGAISSTFSDKIGNFFRDLLNFDSPPPDQKRKDDNGATFDLRWVQITQNPIARSTLIGGWGGVIPVGTTRRYDIGLNGIQYVSNDTGLGLYVVGKSYLEIDGENCVQFNGNYAGNAVKLIGYDTKRFYGDVETGLWKYTSNGIYYNGNLILYNQGGTLYFNGVATGNSVGEPEITPDVPITDPNAGGANTRPNRERRLLDFSQNQTTNTTQPLAERSTRPAGTSISNVLDKATDRLKLAGDKLEKGTRTLSNKLAVKGAKAGKSIGQTFDRLGEMKTWKGIGRGIMNSIERGKLTGKQTFNSILPG